MRTTILLIPLLVLAIGCTRETIESDGADAEERTESTETAATTNAASADEAVHVPPAVGEVPPDFALESHTGETVTLSDAQGEPVVLAFYRGHW